MAKAKVKKLTDEEKAEQNRDLYNKMDSVFNSENGIHLDAQETWAIAQDNGGQTCRNNGRTWYMEGTTNCPSDEMISHTFGTLMGLIDEGHPGKEVFLSLGFNY